MQRHTLAVAVATAGILGITLFSGVFDGSSAAFQPPGMRRPMQPGGGPGRGEREERDDRKEKEEAEAEKKTQFIAADAKLLALHRDFLAKAEKLVLEYDRGKQYDKARFLCEQILGLVPKHPLATELIKKIDDAEGSATKVMFEVAADKTWQDTGITVIEGKPISITARGSWTLKMEHTLSPEGMEIPKEWRDFKLGSLMGVIYTGNIEEAKPFYIGMEKRFSPEERGRLYVKMHDSDNADNSGKLQLEIVGTFEKGK